jgi:eukaryotic-like serine/threonine-protein kinase
MSMIGKTLGNFEITSQLGKGGMGEVYRAKDRKLGRDVAIKVLPEEFAKDADRVSRFQREAKLLASLNHPNIAAIHGLEESSGTNFLVLELVEGDTLADRIKGGPIPVEESLKLALQIAEALEAAHEKGVIHRDLKPANIKVTPDGKVKVLDFGLAKAFAGEQAELNLSNSPTLSNAATQQGVILGTAAYMSPEQARGKAVDKRADIWAFGCVLFEMLTGRAAFSGRDVTEILAAVIRAEPEWTSLPANLHWRLREVIEHCLKKEAKDRYHDISDVKSDIQRVLADPRGVLVQPIAEAEPRATLRTMLPWIAAAIVLTAIIAGVAVWILKPVPPPEPRQVTRFSYELSKDQQFGNPMERAIAVSPDGRQFVYGTSAGLYLRSMDDLDAKLIPGTAGNQQRPFFSPDGKWIGFYSSTDRKLKKITRSGGAPVTLGEADAYGSFSWGADDTIVYGQRPPKAGIFRVSANGGTSEQIVKPAENELIVHPQLLPDGKSVMFTSMISPRRVCVQSLQTGERKDLFEGDTARYLPTGHIVYGMQNSLFAIQFDPNSLKVSGGPVSLVEGVLRAGGAPQYAVSDSGTLVYVPGTATVATTPGHTLVWVDRNGKEELLAAEPHQYFNVRISPDGTKVALDCAGSANLDIWIWDLIRKTMTRLTFDAAMDLVPLWTKDGKRIAFASSRERRLNVWWRAADGTGKDEVLGSATDLERMPSAWSSDGKTLVMMAVGGGNANIEIGALSLVGDRKYRPLLKEKYSEYQPQISPSGKWMAYTSEESGQAEVYVRPFPDVDGGRWQVSTGGGNSPLWSRDGRELFYHSGDATMAVAVKTEPAFSLETPKILFRASYAFVSSSGQFLSTPLFYPWDISPDGKRFLMIKPPGVAPSAEGAPRKINIVLNWFEELKQRVPVK